MAKMANFGQKGQKRPKMAKKAIFGDFRQFWRFLTPPGLPRGPPEQGFYINPSRRGPAVPAGGSGGPCPARDGGKPPEGVQGGTPWGVAVRSRSASGSPALRPPVRTGFM